MRGRGAVLVLSAVFALWPFAITAQQGADRLSDKEVKALIEQVEDHRSEFHDNLDNDVKRSKLRGPNGETDVSAFLDDYKDNVNKLKDRFKGEYSASAELATVLRQATTIDRFMRGNPGISKGRSEWVREAASLKALAAAYATTFPTPDDAPVRRINDKETAASAQAVADAVGRIKDALGKVATLAKPDRQAAEKDAEALKKTAETLRSRTSDGKPASAEFRQLVGQIANMQKFLDAHPVPEAMSSWTTVQTELTKLRQAFNAQ
ncbi:MAG TPA: hypothetical protein VLT86_04245 [Vicinamibacterales bacterium]|nr:hypothetical protein [Vicinamibacterales bacterium]